MNKEFIKEKLNTLMVNKRKVLSAVPTRDIPPLTYWTSEDHVLLDSIVTEFDYEGFFAQVNCKTLLYLHTCFSTLTCPFCYLYFHAVYYEGCGNCEYGKAKGKCGLNSSTFAKVYDFINKNQEICVYTEDIFKKDFKPKFFVS